MDGFVNTYGGQTRLMTSKSKQIALACMSHRAGMRRQHAHAHNHLIPVSSNVAGACLACARFSAFASTRTPAAAACERALPAKRRGRCAGSTCRQIQSRAASCVISSPARACRMHASSQMRGRTVCYFRGQSNTPRRQVQSKPLAWLWTGALANKRHQQQDSCKYIKVFSSKLRRLGVNYDAFRQCLTIACKRACQQGKPSNRSQQDVRLYLQCLPDIFLTEATGE